MICSDLSQIRNRVLCPHTLTWTGTKLQLFLQLPSMEQWWPQRKNTAELPHRNISETDETWSWWNTGTWLFWREPDLWATFLSASFSTGCGHSGQELLALHSIFKQACSLATYASCHCMSAFCHSNCSLTKILSIHHTTQAACMQTLKTPSSGQAARDTGRESN